MNLKFDEAFTIGKTARKAVKQKDYLPEGKFPVIDQGEDFISGYSDDESLVLDFTKPVIIFGDHTRRLKYVKFPFIPGADGTKILVQSDSMDSKFAFYQLQSKDLRDRGYSRHFSELRKENFWVPSIDEQHIIVGLLEDYFSRLDTAIADVKKAKTKAAQFRRSILQAAFSGKLTALAAPFDSTLPEGWAISSIGNLCKSVTKIDPINLSRESFKYVDIGSLEPSSSSLENVEAISTKDAPGRARQLLAVGDSIFATVRPYMKKVAYISQDFDGEIASTGFCVMRPNQEKLHAKYLFYFLLSDGLLDQVLPLQRGVSYPAIRDNDLRNASIPMPPTTEQQKIVSILEDQFSRLEESIKMADDMEKQAAALRRSLLQSAFTGQLTGEVVSV